MLGSAAAELTFVDLWMSGIDMSKLNAGTPAHLRHTFHVVDSMLFDMTCGKRSLPLLEAAE